MKNYQLNDRYHVFIFAVLLGLTLIYLSGCGMQESLRRYCHLSQEQCDTLFGKDTTEAVEKLTVRVRDVEKEVQTLKTVVDDQIKSVQALAAQAATNEALIILLQTSVTNNSDMIQSLVEQNISINERIDYQQTLINNNQIEINNLASEDSIVEYQDPCGTKAGSYNEVLLKTRSGKLLCYFESGNGQGNQNRFLTLLGPGSYKTTDGTNCYFTVNANGTVTNEHY